MNKIVILLLSLAVYNITLASEADYYSREVQNEIRDILKEEKEWIVAVFNVMPPETGFMGVAGLAPVKMKKFISENSKFYEVSQMSTTFVNNKMIYLNRSASLTEDIPSEVWFDSKNGKAKYYAINKTSFEVREGLFKALVFPASRSPFTENLLTEFLHFTAPNAIEGGFQSASLPPAKKPTTVLRHNLKVQREVYINSHYPQEFVPSLISALMKWNIALRSNFYVYKGRMSFSSEECIATNKLCFIWDGGKIIPWAGTGGISVASYDPVSGLFHGGLIGVANPNKKSELPLPEKKLVDDLNSRSQFQIAAKLYINRQAMLEVAHPYPEAFVEALILHEIGHDVGFRHYFMGSQYPSQYSYSDTVMDYLPFPVFHTQTKLGSRDIAKIDRIYFDGASFTESTCSDTEVVGFYNCMPGDLGKTHKWFIQMAESAPNGILEDFQVAGGIMLMFGKPEPLFKQFMRFILPDMPPMPELPKNLPKEVREEATKQYKAEVDRVLAEISKLRGGLTVETSNEVKAYLCREDNYRKITRYLKKQPIEGFTLKCQK